MMTIKTNYDNGASEKEISYIVVPRENDLIVIDGCEYVMDHIEHDTDKNTITLVLDDWNPGQE